MIQDAAQALRALLRRPHAPLLDATLLRPLPGADPTDVSYLDFRELLAATCFLAVYLPASNAIQEDPAEVLRAE